jgi:hypothetical protein
MHMLKIRCIAMDQYGKNNWVPFCFLAWTFRMHSRKQCWNLDPKQRYPNSLQFFLYFVLSSPNQKNCTIVDAKCSMFSKHYINLSPCLVFPIKFFFFFLSPLFPFGFLGVDFGVCNSSIHISWWWGFIQNIRRFWFLILQIVI